MKQSKSWEERFEKKIGKVLRENNWYCLDIKNRSVHSVADKIKDFITSEISAAEERGKKEPRNAETAFVNALKKASNLSLCLTCNCVTKKVCAKCAKDKEQVAEERERERIIKEIKDYRDKFFPILTPDYVVITEMLKYPPFQP